MFSLSDGVLSVVPMIYIGAALNIGPYLQVAFLAPTRPVFKSIDGDISQSSYVARRLELSLSEAI